MMKLLLIFLATTLEVRTKFCELWSDEISKPCYTKDVLVTRAHSAHQLAVDEDTNTLYFSFDFGDGKYVAASLNLNTRKTEMIQGIKDVFAIAASPWSSEVFFGGSHGLYRYDPARKVLKRLATRFDIWWLVLKDGNIYFIQFPNLHTYYYVNKTVRTVEVLKDTKVQQFVFDAHNNVFFSNGSGLYKVRERDQKIILIKNYTGLLGLATDINRVVYVCSDDEGIFIFKDLEEQLKMVANIIGVAAITFDNHNNLIYSDKSSIVRLVPVQFRDNMETTQSINTIEI